MGHETPRRDAEEGGAGWPGREQVRPEESERGRDRGKGGRSLKVRL